MELSHLPLLGLVHILSAAASQHRPCHGEELRGTGGSQRCILFHFAFVSEERVLWSQPLLWRSPPGL